MATKFESDCPSPRGDESDGEEDNSLDPEYQEEEEEHPKPSNNNVTDILKKLQSSGALIKKPKQEYYCYTCEKDYSDWEELEKHIIQHVSLPLVVLVRLPSHKEDTAPSEDENWSDEDEAPPPQPSPQKTPQKIDISQILNKTGLSIKKPSENMPSTSDATLSKLSGLGFTIKKNSTPIKQEKSDLEQSNTNDVMKKLGQLGGIKLKLKSDGGNTNTFKVVNGLKDFKASDEEDEGSGNEESQDYPEGDFDDDEDKLEEQDDSIDEPNETRKKSESDDSDNSIVKKVVINPPMNVQIKTITPKIEPIKIVKQATQQVPVEQAQPAKPSGRPTIKQTPKRGANMSIPPRISQQAILQASVVTASTTSTPELCPSQDVNMDKVVVKQEVDIGVGLQSLNMPLFTGQIKAERTTPPPTDSTSTPAIATIKSEPEPITTVTVSSEPLFSSQTAIVTPLNPVTKSETPEMTVIEINGDSNDEDDDCCVVSATPAPDVKPLIPKIENTQPYSLPQPYSSQSNYSTSSLSSRMPTTPSTEKQHSFNWNAPDSKPSINLFDKSADDIFESLLSSSTKKDHSSLSDASEYISLDTLGPHHSCQVCNTRFTDISLLEEHKRTMGHSSSLIPPIAPSSSTLLPYTSSSNILSSLLPVKQLAEQVGKLSGMGNASQFSHQQNVMINIQAYPGASGVMMPSQPYNAYPSGQNLPGFSQAGMNNMYGAANQMPGQYPGQNFMGHQGYGQQFQPTMPQNTFSTPTSQYPSASPLQSMQQAVYGHSPMGQMRPPDSSPSHPFPPSSPGGSMKPPNSTGSGIKIQNVQTFPPGQIIGQAGQSVPQVTSGQMTAPGQPIGGQMPSPSQIRMAAGANVTGTRPRMPPVRGTRPSIKPGIQVHGQVRGLRPGPPRMPMKRPGGMPGGPAMKRRPDVMLPGKHDNEDCHVMSMQKQRDGLPMIQSVQGAKDKLNLGSQISITKKTVNKEANAMANVLASRGISIKQKQKSRTPSPERPIPHIPNLGAGVSIKHTSKSSNFSIPEAKVGSGMYSCKICKKMFMNQNSLSVHMLNAHPQSKVPMFKCDECPASYPKSLQLQHHKRVFHNVTGANRELGLPVVDLSQEENLKRLSSLGIYSFIPLANREQASGCFGIPVVSVHNGITSGLQALGADGLLSLGPLKPLPNS